MPKNMKAQYEFAVSVALMLAFSAVATRTCDAQYTALFSSDDRGVSTSDDVFIGTQALSADGMWIGWSGSVARVHNLRSGENVTVARSLATGQPVLVGPLFLSGDGARICYVSESEDLVAGDTNGCADIFLFDRRTRTVERMSVANFGVEADGPSYRPAISGDGTVVVFESAASNLVPNDVNNHADVFLHDVESNQTEIINVNSLGEMPTYPATLCLPTWPCAWAGFCSPSADGRFVAFATLATNLSQGADAPGSVDVFVRDRTLTTTVLVSRGLNSLAANGDCHSPVISEDGERVAFVSSASNLVAGDSGSTDDIFVWQRSTGWITRVSQSIGGGQPNSSSTWPSISPSGRWVGFSSFASDLVAGDNNGAADIFVVDLALGTTRREGTSTTGLTGQQWGQAPIAFSSDGMRIAFASNCQAIVAGDLDVEHDVFIRDELYPSAPLVSYCTGKTNSLGCVPRMSASGYPSLTHPTAFFLVAQRERSHQRGLLVWSSSQASIPYHGGTICVAAPLLFTPLEDSRGNAGIDDCSGSLSFRFTPAYAIHHGVTAGTTVCAQFWARDPTSTQPRNISLSDALAVTWIP